jgi:hypothetical protein
MNDTPEPLPPAKRKGGGSKHKKKDFEPKPVLIKGKLLYQIYTGSKLVERNGKMVRVLNRRTYADKDEAESAAELLRIQKINYGAAAMLISERLRSEAIEAQRLLAPHGVSLLEAVRSFVSNLEALKKAAR